MLIERDRVAWDARVRRAVRTLDAAGHDVVLLHRGPHDAEPALVADGGRGRTVLPRGRGRALLRALPGPVRRIVLWGAYAWRAARERPEAVHAHDLPMLAPGWLAARLSGAALVYDTHEFWTDVWYLTPRSKLVVATLERAFIRRADAVVAVSDATAERLRERYDLAAAPVVVRNIPDVGWDGSEHPVRDLRAELGIGDAPLVLHLGAIGLGRGAPELVGGIARLPGTHVLFLGIDPATRTLLDAAIARHAVAGRVHVAGPVPPEVVVAHARQADVGVSLLDPVRENNRLTLPNKLFEYVAAGLPVIATAGTGVGDLVEDLGVGWAVPFGDAERLAEAIGRALEADLSGPLAAAAAELNWESEQARLLDVYAGVTRRRGRPANAA